MPTDIAPARGLTAEERRALDEDGFFFLPRAFDPADAARMQDEWWAELAERWGIVRADRQTWRQPLGDPKRPKKAPSEACFRTGEVKRTLDGVLGEGCWDWPRDWGRACLTMPSGHRLETWDIPTRIWHADGRTDWETGAPLNAFVFSFVAEAKPGGGGTLVLAGSAKLVRQQYAGLTREERRLGGTWLRDRINGLGPWLSELTGAVPGPDDRITAFMRECGEAEGVPLRVVELTGQPGDAYICDPLLMHCISHNCRDTPRMMRIGMVRSHAARAIIKQETEQARRRREATL
jgi:hypothetical protein